MPAADDLRSNMVRGGSPKETELTPREREICARLGPHLRERGLLFVGIDVIGGWLTEINVTSPTGIRAIKNVGGPDIAGDDLGQDRGEAFAFDPCQSSRNHDDDRPRDSRFAAVKGCRFLTRACANARHRGRRPSEGHEHEHIIRLATAAMLLCGTAVAAACAKSSAYMAPIAGKTAATPAEMATRDMLALNTGMFELYGDAAKIFQQNILSKHPVILALFSGRGRPLHPVSPRQAAARGAAGADAVSADEVGRPQHHGAGAGGRTVSR